MGLEKVWYTIAVWTKIKPFLSSSFLSFYIFLFPLSSCSILLIFVYNISFFCIQTFFIIFYSMKCCYYKSFKTCLQNSKLIHQFIYNVTKKYIFYHVTYNKSKTFLSWLTLQKCYKYTLSFFSFRYLFIRRPPSISSSIYQSFLIYPSFLSLYLSIYLSIYLTIYIVPYRCRNW